MNHQKMIKAIEDKFGSREGLLFKLLYHLALMGQACDITFRNRKPAINVTIKHDFVYALMYGCGWQKLGEMLSSIKLSNGETISINDIWTVNPMPKEGFSEEQLKQADMSEAEEKVGPNGETFREMIRNTYHCDNKEEEDYYLRRFILS